MVSQNVIACQGLGQVGAAFGDGYIKREDIVIATRTAAKTP